MKNKTIISIVICLVLIPSLAYGGFIDDLKLLTQSLWQWTEQENLGASTKVGNYQGGTGQDSSAWTGVVQTLAGTWSADNTLDITSLIVSASSTFQSNLSVEGVLAIGGATTGNINMNNYRIYAIGSASSTFTATGGLIVNASSTFTGDLDVGGNLIGSTITGKASTELDNLGTVALNASLIPATDSNITLGSPTGPKYFANTYTDTLTIVPNMWIDEDADNGMKFRVPYTAKYYWFTANTDSNYLKIRINDGVHAATFYGGANTNIAFDPNILPRQTSGSSLGNTSYEWANLYIGTGRTYYGAGQESSIYANANDLILSPTGNIGIGTTTPAYTLDIWGNLNVGTSTPGIFKVDSGEQLITVGADMAVGSLQVDEDSGAVTILDMSVSDSPAAGTEQSYDFQIDSTSIFTIYAEADSSGGIQNKGIGIGTSTPLSILHIDGGTATTTVTIGGPGAPACFKVWDVDEGGWSYGRVLNGAIIWGTESCE